MEGPEKYTKGSAHLPGTPTQLPRMHLPTKLSSTPAQLLLAQLRPLPGKGCGKVGVSDLFCCWLLPLAMYFTQTNSEVYLTCSKTSLSLALAAMMVYFVDFMKEKDERTKYRPEVLMLLVVLVIFTGIPSSIAAICFRLLLLKVLTLFPKSFTFGEGVIVTQGIILVITATLINHYNDPFYLPNQGLQFMTHILETTKTTTFLISWWLLLTLSAVSTVAVYNAKSWPVNTTTRKIFHLAVILVYIPGLAYDPLLLYAASLGALALMLFMECLRWSQVSTSASNLLNTALAGFTDSKEGGSLILTHIYLLVGVSLPLWVWPHALTAPSSLPLYAGVISVGVADSAASIVGSRWGRVKWFGSDKTVEGSTGAVLASLGVTLLLEKLHLLTVTSWSRIVVSVMVTVMVEASTDQVDNLTLPLVMYGLLVGLPPQLLTF